MIRHLTSKHIVHRPDELGAIKIMLARVSAKEFQHNAISLILVTAGELQLHVNGESYRLQRGNLLHVPNGSTGYVQQGEQSLEIHSITFSNAYLERILIDSPAASYYTGLLLKDVILQPLDDIQLKRVKQLYQMLRKGSLSSNQLFNLQVQKLNFNLLLCEVAGIHASPVTNLTSVKKNGPLLSHFQNLLRQHVRKQHKVEFYAKSLCVSADHLTKVIKKLCRKTAKQCIEEALIEEAEKLLGKTELSILDITDELEFSNISTFSNFFKKHTRITPSSYRKKKAGVATLLSAQQ